LQKSSLHKDKNSSTFYYEFEARLLSRIGTEIAGLEKESFLRNLLLRLSRDPKLPNLWFSLGLMLSDAEMYATAIEAYNMVVKLNPAHKKLWNAKGLALSRLGRNDEATACFHKSLKCYEDTAEKCELSSEQDPVRDWFAQRKKEDAAARKLIFRLRSLEEQAKRVHNN
jgi:tetratricopeptide (TPR) repeat protein